MFRLSVIVMLLVAFLTSCSKEEGEGGTSVITGKVYVQLYDDTGTFIINEYYAPEEDVYIIYGNDEIYSDRFRTNFDGGYRFKYLKEGNYTIFAYSEDLTGTVPSGVVAVKKNVKIKNSGQTVEVDDIVIQKKD